jgi:hypothetical protein
MKCPKGKVWLSMKKKAQLNKGSFNIFVCNSLQRIYPETVSILLYRVARTVVFGGLGTPEMREEVIECARKIGSVESVQSSLSHQELKGRGWILVTSLSDHNVFLISLLSKKKYNPDMS